MKRNCCLLALLAVMLLSLPALAQDSGEPDSVIIAPYTLVQMEKPWPDSIGVPVLIWADEDLNSYAIGFTPSGPGAQYLTVSSIDHSGGPCNPVFNTPSLLKEEVNSILFGWVDFTGIQPCTTSQISEPAYVATMYFRIDPDAPVGTFISIDSTWVPPSGNFVFVLPPATQITPQFDNGSAAGMPNIVLGDTTGVEVVLAAEDIMVNGEPYGGYKFQRHGTALEFVQEIDIDVDDELTATIQEYYNVGVLTDIHVEGTLPANASFDPESRAFSFTPDGTQDVQTFDIDIMATDNAGRTGSITLSIGVGTNAVTEIESPTLPTEYSLSQNFPNPFNPSTTIDFAVPKSGDVRLEIFNVLGQSVRVLVNERLTAGEKRVEWNGLDDAGRPASSGVYLYRLSSDDFSQTKKMMLLK